MTDPEKRVVLAIETSCDETAAAVVIGGRTIASSVVSSQVDLHARYGGVVPEVAGRAHVERIIPVVREALDGAGITLPEPGTPGRSRSVGVDAIASTVGPGLVGALLVGVAFAKSLAMSWGVDFVGVNHLEGHLYASFLEEPDLKLPVIVLIVSGGHTLLIEMDAPGSYRVLGETVDDAAGEAFDKVARYLGLGYPGGPGVERAARSGDAGAIALPRPMLGDGLDFSFSGLKTAVIHYVDRHPEVATEDVAASFQNAAIDVLVNKAVTAALSSRARGICLAGGVAANGPLRERLVAEGQRVGLEIHLPSRAMCTDNAAMIAAAGHFRLLHDGPTPLSVGADAGLRFPAVNGER